jgi:hypothetical protein
MLAELHFDLAQLDAEAPNLHLLVVAAQKLDRPVCAAQGEITGAIQPRTRLCRERIAREPLRRQLRTPMIAAAHVDAADVELARHIDRHLLSVRIEQPDLRVRDR